MNVIVQRGDTLWYYSQLFNIPLRLIIESNPGVNPQELNIGQRITIPGYVVKTYEVQEGETFWKIATERRISLEALLLLNPDADPQNLQIGQRVRIPVRITKPVVTGKTAYDYTVLTEDVRRLLTVYPFMRRHDIGYSVMGKSLPELRIGRGEKKIHLNGSFHANEWITTTVVMRFVNDYLLALTNRETIRGLYMIPFYDDVDLSVVPMVDPDGVNLVINGLPQEEPYRTQVLDINNGSTNFSGWKANIDGVDLNNQFPARWDIEAERKVSYPAPANYPGDEPLTAPEAIAMAELTKSRDFDRVLAFHAQGEVTYWGFLGMEAPESQTLVDEYARVSGYEPIRYVDSYAGYKDWFIQEWRRPGFTVEVGRGRKPLPLAQFGEIYQECLGVILASLYT